MSGQRSDWRERLHANPSRMEQELAIKLQDNGIHYRTQVEIPITTADFYFPAQPRPLIVFIDGQVHLGKSQMFKDEELRTLLRKKGYQVLVLFYNNYSDKKRDDLYCQILNGLAGKNLTSYRRRKSLRSIVLSLTRGPRIEPLSHGALVDSKESRDFVLGCARLVSDKNQKISNVF